MKKYILIILILLIGVGLFMHLYKVTAPHENSQIQKNTTKRVKNTNTSQITEKKRPNKICDAIEKSDIIIKLDLPKEYTDATSYGVGFLFKSSHGDQARLVRLASKKCDYRVGFSKEDFVNINIAPNSPFAIIAEQNSSMHFSYVNWPINMSFDKNGLITEGMPKNGKTITVEVDGVIDAYQQYKELFN